MTTETQNTTNPNSKIVTMTDGSVKNFGEKGRLLSSQTITDKEISITFHIVTGEQITFTQPAEGLSNLLAEAAAYGFANKIKNATSGATLENVKTVIEAKVEEFKAGTWVSRQVTGESFSALTQLQTAYALANGIDPYTSEGTAKVNAIFSALSKEDKVNLQADKAIRFEIAKLRLAAAQAELEGSASAE